MKTPEILPFKIQADDKEIFEIGDFSFDIVEQESKWEIPEFSKELSTHIVAKTSDVKKAIQAKLFDDDIEDDVATVHIDFPAIGLYQNGVPDGNFEVTEDKCEATYAYVRKEGFEYRLDFFGTITFKENWVAYNGYLKPPYDTKPVFPVKIYKKFNISTLDWSNYKFTAYEEALQAPPEVIRYLHLTNPDFEEIPEKVFSFINLKELVIACKWPLEKLPLKSLSKKIGSLQMLTQLAINGTQIETLPDSIGELKNLNRFYFNTGQLKTIPEGLLQLPKLEHLTLFDHQLETLPIQAHLPVIKSLNFSNNQLKTLPANLLRQGNLSYIDLEKNPLESLPQEINNIADVKLSMADKKRLMDFDYKGADGKGTDPWDDDVFFARGDAVLTTKIETVFKEKNIATQHKALSSLVKKSIAFKLTDEEDYTTIGNHRFGGMPDLPENINYPNFIEKTDDGNKEYLFEFIAQVNCEDISSLQDYLPRKGILFFFLETIHNIYTRSASNPCKVIYVQDPTTLQSGKRFQFSEADYYEMFDPVYLANKADAVKEISFPSFYASYANQYLFKGDAAALQNEEAISDELWGDLFEEGANKTEYKHTINAYGFTQHEAPELQASLKLKGNPEDWIILLKVGSTGDFMWGDAGDLFFVIHKSDLAKGDFSSVFVTIESS